MTFENLTGLAFRHGPAAEANQLIDEVRRATQAEVGAAVSYEVVLTGRPPDYLREEVAPRLAFFLRAKRYRVSRCRPVFLSLFLEEQVYFVRAEDFFRELHRSEGLSEETFAALAGAWEATGRSARAALPGARVQRAGPDDGTGDGRGRPPGDT
jgi:hypothetical protein